jgi:S1-C subfamily serine protease
MKHSLKILVCTFAVLFSLIGALQFCLAEYNPNTPQLVAKTKPAVVQIYIINSTTGQVYSATGWLYHGPNGIDVVTNAHVMDLGDRIRMETLTGVDVVFERLDGYDNPNDLALIRVSAKIDLGPVCLQLADPATVQEGQHILVIGNPKGLTGTISDGMISAIRHNPEAVQITAPISHGSSGSPVINDEGKVAGVVKSYLDDGQNLNLCVPVAQVAIVARQDLPAQPIAQATPAPQAHINFFAPTAIVVPTPAPSAVASTQKPTAIGAKWPDGRKLLHADKFVTTRVVNVGANDTLKLRSGPGTSFRVLAEIPADETNITAFNYDQVWDGDTWWCPVEWKGLRGYVGRSHLPKP